MRRDNIIRIAALIGLCALVYYFSFETGREAMRRKTARLESALEAKQKVIDELSGEVRRLKAELRDRSSAAAPPPPPPLMPHLEQDRFTIRLNSSRILFEERLVLTCLEIDRSRKWARVQVNLVKEDKLWAERVGLGDGLRFRLEGKVLTLILDKIQSSFIGIQIIEG